MAILKVKSGVQPQLVRILAAISRAAAQLTEPTDPAEVWITSGIDGQHSANSLHYALRAVDIRTKNFPSAARKRGFAAALQSELGPAYDVLLESEGKPNEHLHVEYDP